MSEDESQSYEHLSIQQRQENLDQISQWFQDQKLIIANTELFSTQVFDVLQNYCQTQQIDNVPEFDETKQLLNTFYTKAKRLCMKIKQKTEPRQQLKERLKYINSKDEEVEKNREILIEVKKKLYCLIRENIALPFVINYIRVIKALDRSRKLTLMIEDSLLDCINWYLMNLDITEEQWNQELPQESKLKEILALLLEIIHKQQRSLERELSEIIRKFKKSGIPKQLDYLIQIQESTDKYTRRSAFILLNLTQLWIGPDNEGNTYSQSRTNGRYNLVKLLLSQCWYEQIGLPDILIHTKIAGTLEKVKSQKAHSNLIRLKQKITYLRQIYRIPQIKKWCVERKIMPFELILIVPLYLQDEYNNSICQKKQEYCDSKKDYYLESQLHLLITKFSEYKFQLRQVFNDLRFQQNKAEIYNLYSEQVNEYNGDLDKIPSIQSIRFQKDIQIACRIRHLEMLLQSDTTPNYIEQIMKFNFLVPKHQHFQFLQSSYDRLYTVSSKDNFIKLYMVDLIGMGQPFPYIFEFIYFEDGKLQQMVKNNRLLGQFFYCPQIRAHFLQKYQYNIQLESNDNKVIFTYIPKMHQDWTNPIMSFEWKEILLEHLRLMAKYKNLLGEEISFVINSEKFKLIKSCLHQNQKNFKEHINYMLELEQVQSQKKKRQIIKYE